MTVQRINREDARALISSGADQVQLVDIRDEQAYHQGHIEGAIHLVGSDVQQFLAEADPDLPLIVYCYHGHTSLSAAAWFHEQGFS
ncbi:MAG: rhodanese-like domain-containing protein, partial [Gammaproteobacteria bacterium]